jgi:AcrR family transcriptional regulator
MFHAIIYGMNTQESKRSYQMSKRAESAAQTERAIFSVTADLWRERPLAEITLDAIAERANVSVRTIIRRFGSRDELFNTCIQNDSNNIESDREKAEVGNVESAIHYLLKDYEAYGDAIVRTLAVENQIDAAQKVLQAGRAYHRQWCARIFEPFLPNNESQSYEHELTAFVAATELYLWKLLRRDLEYDLSQTHKTFKRLINGLINKG